jgi:hypothetical protein
MVKEYLDSPLADDKEDASDLRAGINTCSLLVLHQTVFKMFK